MKKLVIGFAILGSIAFVGATGRALAADPAPAAAPAAPRLLAATTPTPPTRPRPSTTSKTTRSKAIFSARTASSSAPRRRPNIRA